MAVASHTWLQPSWGLFLALPWTECDPGMIFMNKRIHTLKALILNPAAHSCSKTPLNLGMCSCGVFEKMII